MCYYVSKLDKNYYNMVIYIYIYVCMLVILVLIIIIWCYLYQVELLSLLGKLPQLKVNYDV